MTPAFHGLGSARPKPSARPSRPSGHKHAGRRPHRGVGKAATRHTGRASTVLQVPQSSSGAVTVPALVEEEGRGRWWWWVGEMLVVGEGGESGRRCTSGRDTASGRCASMRGRRQRDRARRQRDTTMHACQGGVSLRGGAARRRRAARRRGASRRGGARRGGARRGVVAAMTTEEERRDVAISGKRLSVVLEGNEAYIEPPPFVTGRVPNRN
jgi:hypothetical protein